MSPFLDKIVTRINLCRAVVIFNITFTIFTSPVTPAVSHWPSTSRCQTFCNIQSNHLAIAGNDKHWWRCELKRDGWCLGLTVSALWQSTGVAKAQIQIQTIPTNPTKFPSLDSSVSSLKPFSVFPPHQSHKSHAGGSLCTGSVLYSAH